ncbi:actin cross-linking, Fascin, Glycoside hydrolase [Artemisia annua]|uniref:Actin cross-linking, Fascin, Glycoside hydrolase n=1 Tax=Artemisia annua TaxID=35608 RepID=A0A2U1LB06_ARTAN|nr:actin cross-linking, Fascin, Glycoside hydrolase [Artemisia annua]
MIKAVNLGGWLVTEGWMKPSLFDNIPNKDLLDGDQLQLKSVTIDRYLAAELGGGTNIVANRSSASGWETFPLWRINETSFRMRVFNKQFLGLDGINLVATSTDSEKSGIFEIIRKSDDPSRVRIKAPNGLFLQAKTENLVTADSKGDGEWGNNDPSVFKMTILQKFQGEFQLTNGHGPLKAPQIMKDHWETFIVEKDFEFIATSRLNAVRIPVGWWTASDPTPPKPFVGGSLQYLDKAFLWAEYAYVLFIKHVFSRRKRKYNLKVILDLHAAPGSQNGFEHSATRDGLIEWGLTDENIQETVRVIEFFTARYATNRSLYAVQLINEPNASGVTVSALNKYYDAGYKAVRRHAPNAFVILATRLSGDAKEFFPLAKGMPYVVLDVHYYNLFSDIFNGMTVEQNINFIQTTRSNELQDITTTDGPLTFAGEWVAEWQVRDASKEDFQRFSKAQLDVFGRASFGWAYWSLKHVNNHWSMEWMIKNGYINL